PDEMHSAPGGLGLQPGPEQHVEPGGVAELQPGAVDDKPVQSLGEAVLQWLTQQIGGVVIQLTRRSHDGTGALLSHLDQKPARLCAADRPAVHAVSLSRPRVCFADALEHYALRRWSGTITITQKRTYPNRTHLRPACRSG